MTRRAIAETWKHVVGWKGYYEVSNKGRVRSVARVIRRKNGYPLPIYERILKPAILKRGGYLGVALARHNKLHTFPVHILVARAFHGKCPKGKEVRHLDGRAINPNAQNLCYGTKLENGSDKVKHGNSIRGERHWCHKLKKRQIIAIRSRYIPYRITFKKLASEFGVSVSAIRGAVVGETWGWL